MNWKNLIPLVLAIVLGVLAAKFARDAILKNRTAATPAGKFTRIVVASGDVAPGRELKEEDLTLAQVQADMAPSNGFAEVSQVIGRVSKTLMVKGQSIVEPMLAPKGAGSGLQALVPPGMRAVSVEVNEFSGVAGLLTPGCRVDIIATLANGTNGSQIARTIVQNVTVTAVGQKTAAASSSEPPPQQPQEMFRSVTVLATLPDAEAIELACATGRPRLVLRGGRDQEITQTAGITLGELRGSDGRASDPFIIPQPIVIAPPPPATQPVAATQPTAEPRQAIAHRAPPRRVVKLIKGGVESSVTLSVPSDLPANAYGTTDTTDPFGGN